ncbi:glycosyltransferase family 29 protein [Sphingobium sp. WCS2017Hpa-17]|uniref:glycosyltransferase family 29 protein n=1 Tax=Sphingobium sp. WCS2017Hpa-17 TaxID=3073638 RepID=UPI00288C1E8C|nr:glycosyltransferase family 29 protein [Sphingobium sp. WCS2017Hpa-17]
MDLLADDVAVVGSSSILLNAGNGPRIDAHRTVVRFNRAQLDGFVSDVGSKTDLLYVAETIIPEKAEAYRRNFATMDCPILTKLDNVDFLVEHGVDPARCYFHKDFEEFVRKRCFSIINRMIDKRYKHKRPPRSGITILSLLLGPKLPEKPVDIYGIEVEDIQQKGWKTHFFARSSAHTYQHLGWHCPPELEFEVLNAMADQGAIRINR